MSLSTQHSVCLFILLLSAELFSLSKSDVGTAGQYAPPYLPTACRGRDASQFPTSNLFGAAGEAVWDEGAACGRQYQVRCLSAPVAGTCVRDKIILIRIVDRAVTAVSRSSNPAATIVLSTTAFSAIANSSAPLINIEFQQV